MSTVNINSHHFGFGALDLDNIIVTPEDCLHTQRQPSNKFKEKVMLKQRKVEVCPHSFLTFLTNLFSQELMMNNRIKKLQNEENRLKKQIAIAARLCESAGKVSKSDNDLSRVAQQLEGRVQTGNSSVGLFKTSSKFRAERYENSSGCC